MIVADQDPSDQIYDVSERLMDVIAKYADLHKIDTPILLPALAMTCIKLAHAASIDGRELEAVKHHRTFFNSLCDQLSEAIIEGKA